MLTETGLYAHKIQGDTVQLRLDYYLFYQLFQHDMYKSITFCEVKTCLFQSFRIHEVVAHVIF